MINIEILINIFWVSVKTTNSVQFNSAFRLFINLFISVSILIAIEDNSFWSEEECITVSLNHLFGGLMTSFIFTNGPF